MNFLFLLIGLLIGAAAGFAWALLRSNAKVDAARQDATAARTQLDSERQHAAQLAQTNAEAMRQEFRAMARDLATSESDRLRSVHLQQLDSLLSPLEKNINGFKQQMTATDASMKQQMEDLFKRTGELGRHAEELARALTTDSKRQGNWGEAVLKNILEASGLTQGRDFSVQARSKNEEGQTFIPDVVVHLPEERNIIIDSKVSLTAFTRYVAATDKVQQDKELKEHIRSVRQHIAELSGKDYSSVVKGSIGYVLMFIPNEAAYLAAVDGDNNLATDAYRAHIILLNPTNLLMALQLAYNLWQTQLREAGVKEIYDSAEKLYKKFCSFADNYVKVGTAIDRLGKVYDDSRKQLCEGRGNIVAQIEGWRKVGLNPKDQLSMQLTENLPDETPAS